MKLIFIAVLASALLIASQGRAGPPSFDCARAGTPTEHAICASVELSQLDSQLAAAYGAARAAASPAGRQQIKAAQVAWIGQRDACGSNAACLNDRMLRRLAELQSGGGGPAPVASGGVTGLYCARGGANSLVVRDRGGAADFEVLSIQGGGHSCSVEVRGAQRTATGYVGSVEGCQLTLVPQGGEVVLLAAPFDACKMFCGARAALTEIHFPMSGRSALPGAYDSIGLGEVVCN